MKDRFGFKPMLFAEEEVVEKRDLVIPRSLYAVEHPVIEWQTNDSRLSFYSLFKTDV